MSSHTFNKTKWAQLTLFEQMGNIGSEVGRTMNALRRGDDASAQGAFYRGLDLIDATAEAWSTDKRTRKRELLRSRELFAAAVEAGKPDINLENYFMQYAIAARIGR